MNKRLLFLFCLLGTLTFGQKTISGTFSPAKEYSWLIAYRLKPGSQAYVADTAIENGKFTLDIPKSALPGTYRLVYAVPQDEFYFDVIYDGNENLEFDFKSDLGPLFSASKENILFSTYFREIHAAEQEIINFYTSGKGNRATFKKLTKNLATIQDSYETKSEGLLVSHFIKANHPYIPFEYESAEEYIQNKKTTYFTKLNFEDAVLQGTEFLKNKLLTFVFTALPAKELTDSETEMLIQDNIAIASKELQALTNDYQFYLFHSLWEYASASKMNKTADFIYTDFLKKESLSQENLEKLNQVEINNRLRIGTVPPEIEWKSNDGQKKLTTLEGAKNYILIFWSSTCSHCLKELPALQKELKKIPDVKIIAIGLEEEDLNCKVESEKLNYFEHAIALGKWDSTYADLYDIHQTPTYFILDEQKKIITKPESDKEVVEFLKN